MLRDRITLTGTGFTVNAEPGQERRLYYGWYSFKDSPDYVPKNLEEGYYWKSMTQTNENKFFVEEREIARNPLLYIQEMVVERGMDRVVDECRICVAKSDQKKRIDISFEKPPRGFKKSAYMVSFEWEKWDNEPISAGYFFLVDPSRQRYPFLRKVICPQEGKKGHWEPDRYIFEMAEGFDPDDYNVEVAPLLKERYQIIINR